MKPIQSFIALLACTSLSACASRSFVDGFVPIVDTSSVDAGRYYKDVAECKSFAVQHDPVNEAANDALMGAVIGAAIGAALGGGSGAGWGTAAGAGAGGAGGLNEGIHRQQNIVKRCLTGRGYRVLD